MTVSRDRALPVDRHGRFGAGPRFHALARRRETTSDVPRPDCLGKRAPKGDADLAPQPKRDARRCSRDSESRTLDGAFPVSATKVWYDPETFRGLMRIRGLERHVPLSRGFQCRQVAAWVKYGQVKRSRWAFDKFFALSLRRSAPGVERALSKKSLRGAIGPSL